MVQSDFGISFGVHTYDGDSTGFGRKTPGVDSHFDRLNRYASMLHRVKASTPEYCRNF